MKDIRYTTIRISHGLKEWLLRQGRKAETYDELLKRLLGQQKRASRND
jgi:hypothetical protein